MKNHCSSTEAIVSEYLLCDSASHSASVSSSRLCLSAVFVANRYHYLSPCFSVVVLVSRCDCIQTWNLWMVHRNRKLTLPLISLIISHLLTGNVFQMQLVHVQVFDTRNCVLLYSKWKGTPRWFQLSKQFLIIFASGQ